MNNGHLIDESGNFFTCAWCADHGITPMQGGNHQTRNCEEFRKLPNLQKWELIAAYDLCESCLSNEHETYAFECKSRDNNCEICYLSHIKGSKRDNFQLDIGCSPYDAHSKSMNSSYMSSADADEEASKSQPKPTFASVNYTKVTILQRPKPTISSTIRRTPKSFFNKPLSQRQEEYAQHRARIFGIKEYGTFYAKFFPI